MWWGRNGGEKIVAVVVAVAGSGGAGEKAGEDFSVSRIS